MRYPLADWINQHSDVPHNLALSGMVGELRTTEEALVPSHPATSPEVTERLSEILNVGSDRIFLTHGGTESNVSVLLFLARRVRKDHHRRSRLRIVPPEFLPTAEGAWAIGYAPAKGTSADVYALSQPNNPSGGAVPAEELAKRSEGVSATLVDETFREFTTTRSAAEADRPGRWVTGSLTKAYGADRVRVGYVVAPSQDRDAFGPFLSLVLDELPTASAGQALALLDRREAILGESRSRFQTNLEELRRRIPDAPSLAAPVWFDTAIEPRDGRAFARNALEAGVLVCPGVFFGTPRGVRVCLTRRTFPTALNAYLGVRRAAAPPRRIRVAR
ncbi:MAG: aminotransferase class I/II-fold pyridoxal phosphate-dependent enzyme [Thermoplasmata archaeon]